MFVEERGNDLWVGTAVPRYWLADGQTIGIEKSSTYFGLMSAKYESAAAKGRITLKLDPPRRNPPDRIFARFRHPDKARMTGADVNGKPTLSFDADKEWVELTGAKELVEVTAYY